MTWRTRLTCMLLATLVLTDGALATQSDVMGPSARCYFHKEVFPILVDTHNQCADGFTKPLEKVKFKPWCSRVLRLK